MGFSNYLEGNLVQRFFRQTTPLWSPSGTLYIALSTTNPTDAGVVTEPATEDGYGRASMSNSQGVSGWSEPVINGARYEVHNRIDIVFNMATDSWGTIAYAALFDHETDGNMYAAGGVYAEKAIGANDIVAFPSGTLVVAID